MVEKCACLFRENDQKLLESLKSMDQVADYLNKGIKMYLTKLSQSEMSSEQVQREFELLLRTNDLENIGDIVSTQYDIAMNGYEIGGGGIRLHDPVALRRVFEIMGYSDERIEKNFGHMLEALGSGTPPHGGIAWGLDRLLMILLNEPNIREVMAFPKTGEGRDLLMQAPSPAAPKTLRELGIDVKQK
jgi:aspartyl-tRNA synthetase